MRVEDTEIPDVKNIWLSPHKDRRGLFVEAFETKAFEELGVNSRFVQDAVSINYKRGTFRGLHYQAAPHAQNTLVRVTKGRIFDVALDLRRSASTFAKHVSTVLTDEDWRWLFIPAGFAHGFCTLEDGCEITYKLADHYAPDHAGGVRLDDADLGISWPIDPEEGILSEKDRNLPLLKDVQDVFA